MDIKSFDCQMKSHRSENLNWGLHMAQWLPILYIKDLDSISSICPVLNDAWTNSFARG